MTISIIKNSFKILPRRLRSIRPPPQCAGDGGSSVNACGGSSREHDFRRVFRYFDTNDDGKISAIELRDYFTSVGDCVSDKDAEGIIREFSRGKGGRDSVHLEFGEFVRMAELKDGEGDSDILRQAFAVYEVDRGSGCITPEGLRSVLRRLGDVKSHQECEAMIGAYDLDGNGVLDFHEFQRMMS